MSYGESNDWIVEKCAEIGLRISARQLAEWHRKGLIPEPERVFSGGGGSDSIYPAGTLKQVFWCNQLMHTIRKTEEVGWGLWYLGFDVDERFWKDPIERSLSRMAAFQKWAKGPADTEDEAPSLSDHADDLIRKVAADRPVDTTGFSRRVLRGQSLSELMSTSVSVAIGAYEEPVEEAFREELAAWLGLLLGTGAGLKKRRPHAPKIMELSGGAVLTNLAGMSKAFRDYRVPQSLMLKEAERLRDEFKFLLGAFRGVMRSDPNYFSRTANLLNRLIKMESSARGAMVLVVWSISRRTPGWREGLTSLHDAINEHLRSSVAGSS